MAWLAGGVYQDTLGRPRNIRVPNAGGRPVVLIFLVLCQTGTQGKLFGSLFFWSWSWFWSRQATTDASSRRWCCVKDDEGDDGTGCDERRCYSRSCSVSIQTVVVVAGTSSVLPCPRTGRRPGYAWTVVGCGPGRGGVLTSRVSLRFPALCSGFEETRTT